MMPIKMTEAEYDRMVARIAQLEAALREIVEGKSSSGYAIDAQARARSALETDCQHGQVMQNGCPHCERKIGHKLESDDE